MGARAWMTGPGRWAAAGWGAVLLLATAGVAHAQPAAGAGLKPARFERPLDDAYAAMRAGDLDEADRAFAAAEAESDAAARQRIALERGYLAAKSGRASAARERFQDAGNGPDQALARQARAELAQLPSHVWAELYADSFGWSRQAGTQNLVSTVRARLLLRPVVDVDTSLFLFVQATRDVGSQGLGDGVLPQIYADNVALGGIGALSRLWNRRLGLFAQAGPALALIDDGRSRLRFDARGGAFLGLENQGCPNDRGWRLQLRPCADLYGEAVYVSRFDHNAIAFARGRAGAQYAVTGNVAWHLVAELRGSVDRNQDYYNNFVDGGLVQRIRLLRPFRFDVNLGVHSGRYLGVSGRDPLPADLSYTELRLLAATYFSL